MQCMVASYILNEDLGSTFAAANKSRQKAQKRRAVPLEVNTTAPNKNKTVAANFNLTTDFITPPKEWIPRRLRRGGTTHRRICGASANHPGIAGYPREGKCGRRVGIVPHGQCVLLTVRHGHSVQVGSFRPRFPMVSPGSRTLRTPLRRALRPRNTKHPLNMRRSRTCNWLEIRLARRAQHRQLQVVQHHPPAAIPIRAPCPAFSILPISLWATVHLTPSHTLADSREYGQDPIQIGALWLVVVK